MFDASFYKQVLPERITEECQQRPGDIPVVNLHLASGRVMDLCHIVHLADLWFAVNYFRETESCKDMDLAFLPYELVTMVTVSLHHPQSRPIGFSVKEKA